MTTQITYTAQQLQALKTKGAKYLVVALADIGSSIRGTCLSWHKSHDAACRRVGSSTWYTVVDINDAIRGANV